MRHCVGCGQPQPEPQPEVGVIGSVLDMLWKQVETLRIALRRMPPLKVFIGRDRWECDAWEIARKSLRQHSSIPLEIIPIDRLDLEKRGLYRRATEFRNHQQWWDVISDAPMSTDHAIARFFIPMLCDYSGWAVFMDGDVLVRKDIQEMIAQGSDQDAVLVVKHGSNQQEGLKKGGAFVQQVYPRKNWSSVMLINCGHPSNRRLTPEVLNNAPGRDLHRFYWLKDEEIGELPPEWNWLVGHSKSINPALVHFTDGLPNVEGYENVSYADEWRAARDRVLDVSHA